MKNLSEEMSNVPNETNNSALVAVQELGSKFSTFACVPMRKDKTNDVNELSNFSNCFLVLNSILSIIFIGLDEYFLQ